MILEKLKEALAAVELERNALNDTEAELRSMIARHTGNTVSSSFVRDKDEINLSNLSRSVKATSAGERDGIDDVADILRSAGKPLHITEIAERLSTVRNAQVNRTEIEPGLNRHVTKTKKRRIDKFGPSIFGLPEWKNRQPSLAHIA